MIIITDAKIIKTEHETPYEIYNSFGFDPLIPVENAEGEIEGIEAHVLVEYVKGIKFVNANKESVTIGMDKRTQDLIGMPFKLLESQKKELEHLWNINRFLRRCLDDVKGRTFWQKLKVLFK